MLKQSRDEYEDHRGGARSAPAMDISPERLDRLRLLRKLTALFSKTAAEEALGIPSRSELGDLSMLARLPRETLIKYILQRHDAKRARRHYDLRFGTPETGLYSWAVPKAVLPEPGGRKLTIQQPLHRYSYAKFEGRIGKGYGAGTVEKADEGEVLVTKVLPDQINFVVAHHRVPETFTLRRTKDRNWLLLNTTPVESKALEAHKKVHYTGVDRKKAEALAAGGGYAVSEKIDGAAMLFELLKDKIEAVSYRPSVSGRPVIHTYRIGSLTGLDIPEEWRGTILRGELYGERAGKAIPPQTLGGLLNMSVSKSLKEQRRTGTALKAAVFDALRGPGGKPMPPDYADRMKAVKAALAVLPASRFSMPATTTEPAEAARMIGDIGAGRNPLTREGVVLTPLQGGGKPSKLKFRQEADVFVRNVFPAVTSSGEARAGGFEYSLEPGGPVVGRVGTGFDRSVASDMLANPDLYVGRRARIEAQERFPSGAYRAPSLIAFHEG